MIGLTCAIVTLDVGLELRDTKALAGVIVYDCEVTGTVTAVIERVPALGRPLAPMGLIHIFRVAKRFIYGFYLVFVQVLLMGRLFRCRLLGTRCSRLPPVST